MLNEFLVLLPVFMLFPLEDNETGFTMSVNIHDPQKSENRLNVDVLMVFVIINLDQEGKEEKEVNEDFK